MNSDNAALCVLCLDLPREVECIECARDRCKNCDQLYHKPQSRAHHNRRPITQRVAADIDGSGQDSTGLNTPQPSPIPTVAGVQNRVQPRSSQQDLQYQWPSASPVSTALFDTNQVPPRNKEVFESEKNAAHYSQPPQTLQHHSQNSAQTNHINELVTMTTSQGKSPLHRTTADVLSGYGIGSQPYNMNAAALPLNPRMDFGTTPTNVFDHSTLVTPNIPPTSLSLPGPYFPQPSSPYHFPHPMYQPQRFGLPNSPAAHPIFGRVNPADYSYGSTNFSNFSPVGDYRMPSLGYGATPVATMSHHSSSQDVNKPSFCVNCGSKLSGSPKFCPDCGTRVVSVKIEDDFVVRNQEEKQKENKFMCGEVAQGLMTEKDNKSSSNNFYTPPVSPVPFPRNKNYSEVKPVPSPNKIMNEGGKESIKNINNKINGSSGGGGGRADEPDHVDDFLVAGVETISYFKKQLVLGSKLDDLEVMFSATDANTEKDHCSSVVEDYMSTVNDIVTASSLNNDNVQSKIGTKLSIEEQKYALQCANFDTIKAAKFISNLRKYLFESVFGPPPGGEKEKKDSLSLERDFNEKMQQHEGDFRMASGEMQIVSNWSLQCLLERGIWNSDETENTLKDDDNGNYSAGLILKCTKTDTLISDCIKKAKESNNKIDMITKKRLLRTIMAEKRLKYERAQIMFSLLYNRPFLPYTSALWVAKNVIDKSLSVPKAYERLIRECNICTEEFAVAFFMNLDSCPQDCNICRECMQKHMKEQLFESGRNIYNILCPGCESVIFDNKDEMSLAHPIFKQFLDKQLLEIYEKRLLENSLENDKYFKWCAHDTCTDGITWECRGLLKMRCQNGHYTCFSCGRKWVEQHDNLTCEQFSKWELENNPDYQTKKLDAFLRAIDAMKCPTCQFRYELVRGGCLHFTCSKCQTEFCGFCYAMYKRTPEKGLHCSCPRYCLSILRDQNVAYLQQLLDTHKVDYEKGHTNETGLCEVKVKEGGNNAETPCGKQIKENEAGICEAHYKEYLATLIKKNKIDPAEKYNKHECKVQLRANTVEFDENNTVEQLRALLIEKVPLVFY